MKLIKKILTKCFFGISVLAFLFFFGCGSSEVTIKPNYNSSIFKKDTLENAGRIIKTVDKRNNPSDKNVGIAQVGMFNKKVPYNLSEPVSEFVEKAITNILNSNKVDSLFVPITIIVDSFKVQEKTTAFSETGYFDCSLRFIYPLSKDSMNVIKTNTSKSSSGMDVTNSLERLIYEGLEDCANQFSLKYNANKNIYFVSTDKVNEITIDSVTLSDNKIEIDSSKLSDRESVSNFGLAYLSGNKIVDGFQLTYQMYANKKTSRQFQNGFGYSVSYYDIENQNAFLEGHFFCFTYRYSLRYSFSQSRKGIYFGGSLRLSFGTETIQYSSNNDKTNFFIGPTLEELMGVSIAEKVFLEAGLFQIKHFGSDLLPDDVSFSVGINFKF